MLWLVNVTSDALCQKYTTWGGIAGRRIQPQQIENPTLSRKTKYSLIESDWWLGSGANDITVCYVVHHSEKLAGSERSLLRMIDLLGDKGVRPIVVSDIGSAVVEEAKNRGIKTAEFPIKNYVMDRDEATIWKYIKYPIKRVYNLMFHRRMSELLINENVEIVHINTTLSFYEWGRVAKSCGIPYIFHLREFIREDHDKIFIGEKYCIDILKQARKRIAISKVVKDYWEGKLGTECNLVYNGIDIEKYYRKKEIFQDNTINCIIVGRIHKNKGQLEAVKMIKELIMRGHRNFKLTIVGFSGQKDRYERKLQNYVKNNGLENYVLLKEYRDDVPENLVHMDVGLMLSKSEAFGRTTLEYALGGLLVVGSNSAATSEILEDRQTGILFRQGDVKDLTDKIEWILGNIDMARIIAKCGQEYFKHKFTSTENAKEVYKMYRELIC